MKTRGSGAAAPTVGSVDPSSTAATTTTAEDGKAYRDRKFAAETETGRRLTERGESAATWLTYFQGKSKKSDLADAFLMAHRPEKA